MRSDRDLLAEFTASGSDDAFAKLAQRHYGMVVGVCRRVTGDATDAEDAAQAAFLVLAAKARRLSGREDLGGWLYRVARHVALRQRAARVTRTRNEARAAAPVATEAADDLGVDDALDALGERYRVPLILHYYEGLTCEEIAARLGVRADNVANRLSRGRRLLQQRLVARGVAAPAIAGWLGQGHAASAMAPVSLGKAAVGVAAGEHAAAAMVSPAATALMQGAIKTMLVAKAAAIAAGIALAILAGGIAVAARGTAQDPPPPPKPVVAAQPQDTVEVLDDGLIERRRPAWLAQIERQLATRISFTAQDMPGGELVDLIAGKCGLVIHRAPGAGDSGTVTLQVKDMNAADALKWVGELTATSFPRRAGGIWWDTQDAARTTTPDRVTYRLARIVHPGAAGAAWSDADEARAKELLVLLSASTPGLMVDGAVTFDVINYLEKPPLDEGLLHAVRDRGRSDSAGPQEQRWRALRNEVRDFAIAGTLVDATAALQRQVGIDIVVDPTLVDSSPAKVAICRVEGRLTAEQAVQDLAAQVGVTAQAQIDEQRKDVAWFISGVPAAPRHMPRRVYDLRAAGIEADGDMLARQLGDCGAPGHALWDGLLLTTWTYEGLAALEGLGAELPTLPAAQHAARIAAFSLPTVTSPKAGREF